MKFNLPKIWKKKMNIKNESNLFAKKKNDKKHCKIKKMLEKYLRFVFRCIY